MGVTYKEAGVDISAIKKSQESIGRLIRSTQRGTSTIHGFGHYAGLVEIRSGVLLATHTDGVGTKVMIANALGKYDTVGIDCVAMNVNDVVCVGAAPASFVDYIAANKNDSAIFDELVRGLVAGAKKAGVPIVGGETAIMPDMFGGEGFAFDLAGTVTGLVDKDRVVLGKDMRAGDAVVGACSTGLHSNGYTLARKALFPKYSMRDRVRGVGRIGEALLEPTEIYVRPVLEMLDRCTIHGLAHITGGSFTKLTRLRRVGFEIDSLPPPPSIINLIADQGVADGEMYRTFNMGVGFCVVAPDGEADEIISVFKRHRIRADVIGHITGRGGVRINSVPIS